MDVSTFGLVVGVDAMTDKPRRKPDSFPMRKISDAAESRMRSRTAREQLADTLAALKGPEDIPLPDADDASVAGVLR